MSSPTLPQAKGVPLLLFALLALLLGAGLGMAVVGVPETVTLLILIAGLFAFGISILRVEIGLLVLVFLTYTRFSDIAIKFHGAPSIAKSFVVLLAGAVVLRWIATRERPKGWLRPAFLLTLYGMVGLASILYAADPARTQSAVEDFIKDAIIVLLVVVLLDGRERFRQVIWTLLGAGIFLGTISVVQYLTGTFNDYYWGFAQAPIQNLVGDTSGHRVSGPIGDPNFYAQIMLTLVPLALDRLWSERKRGLRLLAAWALVVCVLTVVFTFSRGAFLAMALALGLMLLYRPPKPLTLLVTLVLVVVLFQFVPSEYTARILTLTEILPGGDSSTPTEVSLRGRTSELLVGWMMFRDHPLLGIGYNNYQVHYLDYSRQLGLDPRLEARAAHNLYIEIAAETGLVGLAAFSILLWQTLKGIWQAWKAFEANKDRQMAEMVAAFGVGLIGYLAAAMFIHDAYPRYLWLLLGIGLALPNVVKQELSPVAGYAQVALNYEGVEDL